ncbi:hypothetical protein CEN40_05030 [Fischerella thermalis CCMEE 5205]|nr:hypothetical protein CEN40_05030 [Fischerella thermalis CCMEE 5205]
MISVKWYQKKMGKVESPLGIRGGVHTSQVEDLQAEPISRLELKFQANSLSPLRGLNGISL